MIKYPITEAEWKIMMCLWKEPCLTLKQIADRVEDASWGYSTIRTMVTRLMEKGIIDADKSSASNFKYYAVAPETDCQVEETKHFLSRVFGGSVSMMVSTLAKQEKLSLDEVKALKKIIEGIEERDKND